MSCFPASVFAKLTQEHVDRALKIARWYGRRAPRAEISDLESAALEGLAKAARDFDPGESNAPRPARRQSFWDFAFKRILGEMKDELRRFDHLTRDQRAMVEEDSNGQMTMGDADLRWLNPQEPVPLETPIEREGSDPGASIADLIEQPNDPIEGFELRDAFCRATAELPERHRLVLLKRELEGYSNAEVAWVFEVTEGRASQLRGAAVDRVRAEIGDSFVDAA